MIPDPRSTHGHDESDPPAAVRRNGAPPLRKRARPRAGGRTSARARACGVGEPVGFEARVGLVSRRDPDAAAYVPGSDFSGVVERLGAGVQGMNLGHEVYGDCPHGSYAPFVAAPAKTMARKPVKRTHVESAAVPVAGQTAWQGLLEDGGLRQ